MNLLQIVRSWNLHFSKTLPTPDPRDSLCSGKIPGHKAVYFQAVAEGRTHFKEPCNEKGSQNPPELIHVQVTEKTASLCYPKKQTDHKKGHYAK